MRDAGTAFAALDWTATVTYAPISPPPTPIIEEDTETRGAGLPGVALSRPIAGFGAGLLDTIHRP